MLIKSIIASTFLLIHSWYPPACCTGFHCRPVACEDILEKDDGSFKYGSIVYSQNQVHPSQDNKCHACWAENVDSLGKISYTPYCLFILTPA